ncbi:hypothetical protein CANARDRAFT_8684 [[Candida] arabinofermentans NRRL YB-2248]|uniref:D-isomer specific 2-hydroxyacid dehydrogenase NAD-binding domain-containing protein n=1 Tax=[Candida] arabinofermentans NRRL YB-2248 TaxID=983967 RepID=A0A1E4SXV1_9ASCO|nr:hypothetical protein CANARDRAFT_8684 [[Candida] arabinofermentans NRRL YB-2248]
MTASSDKEKPKVLYIPWANPIHDPQAWKTLNENFDLIYYDCETPEEWIEENSKPDGGKYAGIRAICRSTWLKGQPYLNHFLFRGEAVKYIPDTVEIIVQSGHGYDIVDVPYLTSKDIIFCNSPNTCSVATADVGTYLVMQSFRYLTYAENCVRKGNYYDAWPLTYWGANPRGHTLGVIGLGNIGFLTAKACKALGMNIVYHGRSRKLDYENEIEGLTFYSDLNEMLKVTDCIYIACPYSEATRHLINFERFKHMKDQVRLVNVARGPIVEQEAVIDALERGQLVGAGFDVHEFEPKIDPRLLDNYKITLLPHIGVSSRSSFEAFEAKCVDNLMKHFYGGGKPEAVNIELLK